MRKFILFGGLLWAMVFPFYAQNRSSQDSLRLERLLKGEGEMKLNPEALQELEMNNFLGTPRVMKDKPWMDFDNSLPVVPKIPGKKVVLTLHPYTANTKYNWDPIYQKKIKVDKNTWRGDRFYELKMLATPTNWAKQPTGMDLMMLFTREFWDFKGRKRRARTLEVLKTYGDSTTVLIKQPLKRISE